MQGQCHEKQAADARKKQLVATQFEIGLVEVLEK